LSSKRDYVGEIEDLRDRTGPTEWDNGITKLLFLCTQTEKLEKECVELAHFPVAIIAAIETYFRWEIRRLIDSGDERYVNSLRVEETPLRISHDLLVAVHGERVTIGELVAYSVRLSNLELISKTMGQLLQADFLVLVKEARDPELRRQQGENALAIIQSASDTLARVKRTFELRHIICHEAHLNNPVRLDEVKELCSACYEFARASNYAIAYHENPNAPLTLDEAYHAASERVQVLDSNIQAVEKRILSTINPDMQKAFDAMQTAWRLFVQREADFNASHHMNGNRGALYDKLASESLYKARLAHLTKYAEKC
jgi:hypothetical protein